MKTILVTGSAGFIGSHLTEKLLDSGVHVIGIDNLQSGTTENMSAFLSNENFQFVESDINNSNLDALITEDIDSIYHLAAVASVKLSTEDPKLVHHHNVDGTISILELARKRRTKTFVLSSSAAVYGDPNTLPITEDTALDPLSPYAASKIAAESYVHAYGKTYGIRTVVLRYFNVFGPRQDSSDYSGVIAIFANRAANGLPLIIEGDGSHTRSFIFVEDVVNATIAAGNKLEADGSAINVSGLNSISIIELAKSIQNSFKNSDIKIEHGPPRLGDVRDSIGSMNRARVLLGFSPSISLEEGLEKTLDWYKESK